MITNQKNFLSTQKNGNSHNKNIVSSLRLLTADEDIKIKEYECIKENSIHTVNLNKNLQQDILASANQVENDAQDNINYYPSRHFFLEARLRAYASFAAECLYTIIVLLAVYLLKTRVYEVLLF